MITAEFIRNINMGSLVNFGGSVSNVTIDSRKVTAGSMFVALPGENVDGHKFVKSATVGGAVLSIVSKNWAKQTDVSDLPLWIVESPEKALQQLASTWRDQFDIPVLAITGTNGKTTIRIMCESILKHKYDLHSTSGNLNNHLGLPLTLLKLNESHTFSLLELGTNHFGEIAFLCELCKPTAGLITNIGYGHTEFFGNLKGVARAKEELFQSLSSNGISFINLNDPYIRQMSPKTMQVTYGMDIKNGDYSGTITEYDKNACATLEINNEISIKLKVPGQAMAQNALAAVAIGRTFSVPAHNIAGALESFHAVNQRFTVQQTDYCRIINDVYNANPNSTNAAIDTFSTMKVPGRRLFVFGDMFELGDLSEQCHRDIGRKIAQSPIDILYTYGPLSTFTVDEARKAGMRYIEHYDNKIDLISALKHIVQKSDTILVKGSRGNQLEEIIEGIQT